MEPIKIALIDDEALFRKGLELIINQDSTLKVTFNASNGQILLDSLQSGSCVADVFLLDLSMPVLDGVDTLAALQAFHPKPKVIILTSHYSKPLISQLIEAGASSFLAKSEQPDIVLHTIKNVAEKGYHFDEFIMKIFRDKLALKKKNIDTAFSKRETEVLQLICEAYSAKEIAQKLYLSPRTVEGHKNSMLEKISAKNTISLVIHAIENRLVDLTRIAKMVNA